MLGPEFIGVAAASVIGSALAVWGVVRVELRAMRDDIRRAHKRIDQWPAPSAAAVVTP